ncbi:MAG: hypothetical protein NT013_24180, partial [Planctomycetia bacterium]|nr:hypothetical protein [Planctomycetia bacterium]
LSVEHFLKKSRLPNFTPLTPDSLTHLVTRWAVLSVRPAHAFGEYLPFEDVDCFAHAAKSEQQPTFGPRAISIIRGGAGL